MAEYLKQEKEGWIRVYRRSLDSSVWKNPIVWMVWSWCLLKANHENTTFPFNGKDFLVKRGQFITGRNKALKELPITAQQYRDTLVYLSNSERVVLKPTNKFTLITIVKYGDYQDKNYKRTNKEPTKNQQRTTYKNDNNDKNILPAKRGTKSMKKYKENEHSDYGEPAQDYDTGEPIKERTTTGRGKAMNELIRAAEKNRGKEFINRPMQMKYIAQMFDSGLKPYTIG